MVQIELNSPAYRLQQLLQSVSDDTDIIQPHVGDLRDVCKQTGHALPKEVDSKQRPGEQIDLTAAAVRKILDALAPAEEISETAEDAPKAKK